LVPSPELVDRARAAVTAGDASSQGLTRLTGGISHDVFSPVEDGSVVVKVFRTVDRDEQHREWAALLSLTNSGVAPQPVHFDELRPAAVVRLRLVSGELSRVLIVGISGSGKSQLARSVSALSRLPLVHLDAIFWRDNWRERDATEVEELVREAVNDERWIIEGTSNRSAASE
jgi:ABC-type glutathione transport system ATPase component